MNLSVLDGRFSGTVALLSAKQLRKKNSHWIKKGKRPWKDIFLVLVGPEHVFFV